LDTKRKIGDASCHHLFLIYNMLLKIMREC